MMLRSCVGRSICMQLPTSGYRLEELRGWQTRKDFWQGLQKDQQQGKWAFLGPGNEPGPDFWMAWSLVPQPQSVTSMPQEPVQPQSETPLLLLQGQVKSHQYSGEAGNVQQVSDEASKVFHVPEGHTSVFVFITDAKFPDPPMEHNAGTYVLVIDSSKRHEFFTPHGALRRSYLEQLALGRPTKRMRK